MENQGKELATGSARPVKIVDVEVSTDLRTIQMAAEVATLTLRTKFGDVLSVSNDEITHYHTACLQAGVLLSIDPTAKVPRMTIPAYFSPVICGVSTKIGRSIISPNLPSTDAEDHTSEMAFEPNLQVIKKVELQLRALGVTLVKLQPSIAATSPTLSYFRELVDGVEIITGPTGEVTLDDIIRRGFILMDEANERKLRAIAGDLEFSYGELEVLLQEYVTSAVRVSLS